MTDFALKSLREFWFFLIFWPETSHLEQRRSASYWQWKEVGPSCIDEQSLSQIKVKGHVAIVTAKKVCKTFFSNCHCLAMLSCNSIKRNAGIKHYLQLAVFLKLNDKWPWKRKHTISDRKMDCTVATHYFSFYLFLTSWRYTSLFLIKLLNLSKLTPFVTSQFPSSTTNSPTRETR